MKFRTLRKIHTYGGVFAAIFLILLGITGVVLTFRSSLRAPPVNVPHAITQQAQMDKFKVVQKAESKMKIPASSVRFSTSAKQPHRISFKNPQGTTLFYSISGSFIERRDRPKWSLVRLMFKLHTGSIVGRTGEIFISIIGIILSVSAVSGILIWPYLMRKIRKRQRRT